jgi:Pyridine nucleotide-disulphide oxidoreductase
MSYVTAADHTAMGLASRKTSTTTHRVVVGEGFGGLSAVRRLRLDDLSVTLVDRGNFHLFQPLYQVATGGLTAGEIATPLRALLNRPRARLHPLDASFDTRGRGARLITAEGAHELLRQERMPARVNEAPPPRARKKAS